MPRPSAAVRVGFIYAMFGIAWIVLSDFISAQLSPGGSVFLNVQTFKGIMFVLVSGVLISFLAAHPATRIEDDPKPSSGRIPLLIFLLLALAIAVTGGSTYVLLRQTIRDDTQRNLGAVAELKARQITDWLSHCQRDAWTVIQGPQFVNFLRDNRAQGLDAWNSAVPQLQQRLDFFRANYGFTAIQLLDMAGQVLLASGSASPPSDSAALIAESQAPGLHLRDFSLERDPEGQEHIQLALYGRVGLSPPGADVLVYLAIDPELFLFPLIQEWPTASDTAETFLVRREGDEVVYLNDLRHQLGTALKLRRPLTDIQLPATQAIQGHQGVFEGRDYRGVPVLAYLKAIPGTSWLMVSKIDAKEAYAALDQLALAAAGLGLGFLMAAGLALRFWWRFEQHARLAQSYRADLERHLLAQHFDYLSKYANDIILLADVDRRILEANDRCIAAYGYTREELLTMRIDDLRTPEENSRLAQPWEQLDKNQALLYETIHRRRDGSTFPAESSVRLIEQNGQSFYQSIVRDITERHQNEQRIRRLSQLYRLLFHINEAIVRARTEDELFRDTCRLIVEEGDFKQAWITLKDPASGLLRPHIGNGTPPPTPTDTSGPAGLCMRLGQPYICNDVFADPSAHTWRDPAQAAGIMAAGCFPLPVREVVRGVLCIYAGEVQAFDHEVARLFTELAADMGFALDRFDLERQRREALAELRASEARYVAIIGSMTEALVIGDAQGRILAMNPAGLRLHGFASEDAALGHIAAHSELFEVWNLAGEPLPPEQWPLARATRGEVFTNQEIRVRRRDTSLEFIGSYGGTPVRDPSGLAILGICTIRDITEQKRAEARIAQLAFYDALTGLPNRILLHERLSGALALAERHHHRVAVGVLDLDHFKHVNDSLGHPVGDALLQEMARRMMACVREEDTVARPGGDEFMLVLPETGTDGAAHVAEKIVRRIAEPMHLDGHELNVSCSIGLSLFPDNGHNRETLIQNADAAMYRAKQRGRNTYQFFTEEMHREAVKTLTLEQHLRKALERDELLMCYQPQVNTRSGVMVGAEALVRWRHADWGLLLPSQFIPLAEESGLIHTLGLWVLRRVTTQIKTWQAAGLPLCPIAINLSASQFRHPHRHHPLLELVTEALHESGIPPHCLELEITESSFMDDTEQAVTTLHQLRDVGVRLTIDDFGTGYSSLGYLQRLPVERLKIDQSFIRALTDNPSTESVVDTIIGLAKNLNFDVLAEGVENEAQWRKIRDKGCQDAQGYYFSRPLPPAELALWLAQAEHPSLPVIGDTSQGLH